MTNGECSALDAPLVAAPYRRRNGARLLTKRSIRLRALRTAPAPPSSANRILAALPWAVPQRVRDNARRIAGAMSEIRKASSGSASCVAESTCFDENRRQDR